MSHLLEEIKQQDETAAGVLEKAGLCTDSDFQVLTREDLQELFPGFKNLQQRKTIFEIIHKQKPVEQLLGKLKEFIPHESFRAALTNNGVLVDYLCILKDMKTQMTYIQSFIDAHVSLLEEFRKNQLDQEPATCRPDPESLHGQLDWCLQGARESLPGTSTSVKSDEKEFMTGQTDVYPQGPQSTCTSDTDGPVMSHDGQTDGGPQGAPGTGSLDTSCEMEDHTGQTVEHPQELQSTCTSDTDGPVMSHDGQTDGGPQGAPGTGSLDTSCEMEDLTGQTVQHPQELQNCNRVPLRSLLPSQDYGNVSHRVQNHGTCTSYTGGPVMSHNGQTDGGPQGAPAKLMYRMVVSGKTFDAHIKLLEKVKDQLPNQVQLVENDRDYNITFVFCPICSRVASDVDAAMTDVKDDKPVILVLMHHKREARSTSSVKTWRDDNKVLLFVHVFYHETIHGLLKCEQNDAAVSEIRNRLLNFFFPGIKDSSGNAQGVGAESASTGNNFGGFKWSWKRK